MPIFQRDDVRIRYDDLGDPGGPPVLLIAPGGMRSAAERWGGAPFDPRARLSGFRVIAMDQRNAGGSWGPIAGGDGWHTYTADQLALLDHLGIGRFSVLGMCIGGAHILALGRAAPARLRAAVMLQPIGLHENRDVFFALFDDWARDIAGDHPEAGPEDFRGLRQAMFGGDFVFSATRQDAVAFPAPALLMMGDDVYHPAPISRELARLLPDVTVIEHWKEPEHRDAAAAAALRFLESHAA